MEAFMCKTQFYEVRGRARTRLGAPRPRTERCRCVFGGRECAPSLHAEEMTRYAVDVSPVSPDSGPLARDYGPPARGPARGSPRPNGHPRPTPSPPPPLRAGRARRFPVRKRVDIPVSTAPAPAGSDEEPGAAPGRELGHARGPHRGPEAEGRGSFAARRALEARADRGEAEAPRWTRTSSRTSSRATGTPPRRRSPGASRCQAPPAGSPPGCPASRGWRATRR